MSTEKKGLEQGDVATKERTRLKKPRNYKVLLHNDDFTTQEFVVLVLMRFFRKTQTEATQIMLQVHHEGVGVCGVFTHEVAELKVAQVSEFARDNGYPLKCTMEPE
ncbi:MAG: ATP-dependent Clp protease adapter ClpS [Myxococcota bacterium]